MGDIGAALPVAFLSVGVGLPIAILVGRAVVAVGWLPRGLLFVAAAWPPGMLPAQGFPMQFAIATLTALPLAASAAFVAFHRAGPRWTALARALGDTPGVAFGRVEVPMAFPGLLAAAALLFGRAAVEVRLGAWPLAVVGGLAAGALILAHRNALAGTRVSGVAIADPPSPPCAWCPADLLAFPHLSVRENLSYAGANPREVAAALSLDGVLDRRPRSLSRADRQCIAVGRALLAPGPGRFDAPLAFLEPERADAAKRLIEARSARTP